MSDATCTPVIISGIAGKFPESDGLEEFRLNLYNATDLVTDCRKGWDLEMSKIPRRMGQLKNLDKFDAEFFGVHSKQAENMDPRLRCLLELSHECLIDSGTNPVELSGSNTGVYIGASGEEALEFFKRSTEAPSGYCLPGALLSTLANRLSFTLNLRGPSISMDTACSSSLLALQQALCAIRFGACDSALVGGVQLCVDPMTSFAFSSLGMTAGDGKCKSFDSRADGYVRSEAAVAIYICKENAAKRCYATILNAGTNTDGYKANGFTYPSGEVQENLLRQVYTEAGVNPNDVGYVEAHGTGTQAGDFEEVNALARVFCVDRDPGKPLLLGSVKSNMGHSEPASGLCGITKLVLIAQTRIIPGNLHFTTPNPKIPALFDGRIKVITANTPFEGELLAINSFGFGGSNVHALLRLGPKEMSSAWLPGIPTILPLSGRTAEIKSSLEKLAGMGDLTVAPLLHSLGIRDVPGHGFRSFAIADGKSVLSRTETGRISKNERSPLWFIFSGMGAQYPGMAKDMMKLDNFRTSIDNSIHILQERGFDLTTVLFSDDSKTMNDVLNSCISIVAVQMALVDLFEAVGVVPEKMLGHSLGEIATAYADKCLTSQQTLNVALVRGRACRLAEPGTMASVGLSWKEALKRCPEHVFPACDNSADNVTISGKVEFVTRFVQDLQSEGIFARSVESAGMAFHSKHMEPSATYMREHFLMIIPEPKPRSFKWISTSAAEAEMSPRDNRLCSVDYLVNNVLAPVRFREAIRLIPGNAVVIEIAPHCLLQPILKRALPDTVANIGVMNKRATSNSLYFLTALGKLYLTGHNPNFGALYEKVKFPLGPSTPMISPVIPWDHSQSWIVPVRKETSESGGAKIQICPQNESDKFYLDHIIDGRILFPAVGYMHLVWSTFAKRTGRKVEDCPVIFTNVRFQRATILYAVGTTEFHVNIHPGSGEFEVLESDSPACHGKIQELVRSNESISISWSHIVPAAESSTTFTDEFYRLAHLRGYGHKGVFSTMESADPGGEWAEIGWRDNWVAFLDHLLQLGLFFQRDEELLLPVEMQKVVLDPQALILFLASNRSQSVPARALKYLNAIVAPGIEIRGLKSAVAPRKQHKGTPKLSAHRHVPFVKLGEDDSLDFQIYLTFCLDIVMDNTGGTHFIAVEFNINRDQDIICSHLRNKLAPKFESSELFLVSDIQQEESLLNDVTVTSTTDLRKQKKRPNLIIVVSQEDLHPAEEFLDHTNFLLCVRPDKSLPISANHSRNLKVVAQQPGLDLYRRAAKPKQFTSQAIEVKVSNFDWVEKVKHELSLMHEESSRLYLYSNSSISGLQGLVKCLRKEGYSQVRSFEVLDEGEILLDFHSPIESLTEIIKMDLVHNVYSSGAWGCLTAFPIDAGSQSILGALGPHFQVDSLHPGDLSTLRWLESPLETNASGRDDPCLCKVHYSALNFRDIMVATGKLSRDAISGDFAPGESILGIEYSGVLENGTPVFGMQASKCLATAVEFEEGSGFMWPVPKHWTLAEAATVPIAYGTAYYALVVKGKIREGETVLIHSGAGGVGQAAITVALSRKCGIITTVSTEEKREYLKGRFPQLTDACFANSRDPVAFESHVMGVTNGRGVDVVLNSLSQESLQASVRCLGNSGRFLEIGKFDLFNNSELGMSVFLRSIEFHGVLLDYLFQPLLPCSAQQERIRLNEVIQEGIQSGTISPLPYTEYDRSQMEEAFRFMASGKHTGKILIKVRDNSEASPSIPAPVLPRTYFYPHKFYIMVGGLGGMGLEIGNWMINRGARNLIFVSRSSVRTWYQENRVKRWQAQGATITISTCDVTTPDGVRSLIQMAGNTGPVGGIFNLAALLKDALLENQTRDNFEVVAAPKIRATLLLDSLTRESLLYNIDYFVVFSSVASLSGNAGQSNYGFANSAIERICMRRRAEGLHGLAIQWGPVGDVGIYHTQTGGEEISIAGCAPQRISSVLEVLDVLLKSSAAVVSSFIEASSNFNRGNSSEAESLSESVVRVLGIKEFAKLSPGDSFTDLGMDSLMLTEIKQLLERKLGSSVSSTAIMSLTFAKLAEMEMNEVTPPGTEEENTGKAIKFKQTSLVLPKSTLVSIESKRTKSSSNLFLVHPVEGNVCMLEGLVRGIDCRVYGFECTPDAPLCSIPALASHYIESMRTVQAHGPYKLSGYSFGGAVACEMAIQLEMLGESLERLVLLDGSHQIPRMFSETFSRNFKVEGETLWLAFFLLCHSPQSLEEVESELMAQPTWELKLDLVATKLSQLYPSLSLGDIKILGTLFVKRMSAGCSYYPQARIRCETVLIRAGRTGYDSILGKDYGLNEICAAEVQVIVVDGHHSCFCEEHTELNIARIVNDALE